MSAITVETPGSVQRNLKHDRRAQKNVAVPAVTESSAEGDIANLAYALWQQRGCPSESPEIDWFTAEEQLRSAGDTKAHFAGGLNR